MADDTFASASMGYDVQTGLQENFGAISIFYAVPPLVPSGDQVVFGMPSIFYAVAPLRQQQANAVDTIEGLLEAFVLGVRASVKRVQWIITYIFNQ